jgi:CheY-like chemotaxis protein
MSESTARSKVPLPRRRILVVDDTRLAAVTLGKLLEALGQQVLIRYDAESALQAACVERPDLVITDLSMPDIDGFELAQRIREFPELAAVPLVALTGYGHESDRRRTESAGFQAHLVKPVSLAALQGLLGSLPSPIETPPSATDGTDQTQQRPV